MRHCQHVSGTIAPGKSGLSRTRTALTKTFGVLKPLRESCPARYRRDAFCRPGGGGFEQDAWCLSATAARKTARGGDREDILSAWAIPRERRCPPPVPTGMEGTYPRSPRGGRHSQRGRRTCGGTGEMLYRSRRPQAPPPRPLQPPAGPFTFWGWDQLMEAPYISQPLI